MIKFFDNIGQGTSWWSPLNINFLFVIFKITN